MAIYRGFVRSLEVRGDGWAEFVLQAVHSSNGTQGFYITDLDGNVLTANRRLAHLSLLRDAIARTLPVEVEYDANDERGNVVDDLTIFPRPSFDGRQLGRRIEGVVIGILVYERGPESGTTPYRDEADGASVTLLLDDGSIEQAILDLQRPDQMTAHSMLGLVREAYRTRRPLALIIDSEFERPEDKKKHETKLAISDTKNGLRNHIVACEYAALTEQSLNYEYAFIERLGQRYESYESDAVAAASHVRVVYTTAPSQTPEGDVSDNGSFLPKTLEAWVHDDSPLLVRLEAALRDRLQVKLGILENEVHEVEMVGHLGSAARPIWVKIERVPLQTEGAGLCDNTPTISVPTEGEINEVPHSIAWRSHGYFNEGIWRFTIKAGGGCRLLIDGQPPCCETERNLDSLNSVSYSESLYHRDIATPDRFERQRMCHSYMNGMHNVEIQLTGHNCSTPFQFNAYRIR